MTSAPAPWTGPPWGRRRRTWVVAPAAVLAVLTIAGCAGASSWHAGARAFDGLAVLLLLLAPAAIVLVVRGATAAVAGTALAVVGPLTYLALGYQPGPALVPLGFVVVALGATRRRVLSLLAGIVGALGVV